MKKILILDFDGVVAMTEDIELGYINKRYCINSKISDYDNTISSEKNVSILTNTDISFEEFYYDFTRNYAMSKELHKDVILLPYAKKVIEELSKEYYLFISTARNSLGIDVIKYVLKNNGILQYFNGFHFVYYFDDKMQFIKSPKAEFISSFKSNVSFFVDDSEREIEKTKNIVPSILFDVTQTKNVQGSWSAHNWLELADLLL